MDRRIFNKVNVAVLVVLFYMLFVSLAEAAFKDSGWGTRSVGMGGAFTAVSDDASAPLWNAAGIAQLEQYEANFMYARLFTGLDLYAGGEKVDLGLNYGAFVFPSNKIGNFGVSWANFVTTELYEEDTFTLSYAKRINDFAPRLIPAVFLGVNLKYLNHSYTLDERTRHDPVFVDGRSKGNFTGDVGVLIKANGEKEKGLCIGLMAKNISEPDVGLKVEDKVPFEGRFGLAYRMGDYNFLNILSMENVISSVDVSYRDEDLNVYLGWESWFVHRTWGFRIGGNDREVTSGFSFNNETMGKFGLQFDYAFIWPLELEDTSGSHRVSLTVRFGESAQETEAVKKKEEEEEQKRREEEKEKQRLQEEAEKARREAEQAKRETAKAQKEAREAKRLAAEREALVVSIRKKAKLQMREEGKKIIIAVKAHFKSGSLKISASDKPTLDQVIEILKQYPQYKVRVEGHTDSVGRAESNLKLSEKRAKSVFDYLVKNGIASERLKCLGFGETKPISSNKTAGGRAKNRRVEFVILTQ